MSSDNPDQIGEPPETGSSPPRSQAPIGHKVDFDAVPQPVATLRTGTDGASGHRDLPEVDLGIIWLPVNEADLTVGPTIRTESIVLAVATDHPMAARESIRTSKFALSSKQPKPTLTTP